MRAQICTGLSPPLNHLRSTMEEAMAELAPPLPELILSLEQATALAKQIPITTDQLNLFHISNSLHQLHLHLSTFLSKPQFPLHFPPPPLLTQNSLSSATGAVANDGSDEPMQVGEGEDGETERNSKGTIGLVEQKMRNCFIKNKRPRRTLSPSAVVVVEERQLDDGYDPHITRLKALDLVYHFHG